MGKRYVVQPEDVKNIVSMYKRGKSIQMISILLNFTERTVKSVIKQELGMYSDKYVDPYKKKEPRKPTQYEIEKDTIISMYKSGKTIKEISNELKIVDMYVESVLVGAKLINPILMAKGPFITIYDIRRFRDYEVQIGSRYVIRQQIEDDFGNIKSKKIVAKVLKKYPYIVTTDKGTFQYFDLYINRNCSTD